MRTRIAMFLHWLAVLIGGSGYSVFVFREQSDCVCGKPLIGEPRIVRKS